MTLVSIVGDFYSSVIPIFYEFKDRIDKHIIIYDDFKNDVTQAKNIINGTTKYIKENNLPIRSYSIKMDEDSLKALHEVAEILKGYESDTEKLYINITDGLANIGVLLSSIFLPLGSNIVTYDRFDNEYNLLTKDNMLTCKVEKCMSIKEHFALKNIEVAEINDKKIALKHKDLILKIFENHNTEFKRFANEIMKPEPKWHEHTNILTLLEPFDLHQDNIKENQMFITGGLFEYYIFLKIHKLGFDDIEVGVKVRQYYNEEGFIPNEFDIFIMKDNHLHMIECKYTDKIKLDALVYKYMALKNLIDEDSKIIMITAHPEYKPNLYEDNTLAHLAHKRARENRMLLLGNPIKKKDEFVFEVERFFELAK